jgi:hypothetical protein
MNPTQAIFDALSFAFKLGSAVLDGYAAGGKREAIRRARSILDEAEAIDRDVDDEARGRHAEARRRDA